MAASGAQQSAALVGRFPSAEMEPVRRLAGQLLVGWAIREFATLSDLGEAVQAEAFFPELVIVCQHHRAEHASEDVQRALERLPLARWVCVVGAWCLSEGRHGSRWPLTVRVPLAGAERRLRQELAVVGGELPALVLTASREEVFEFDVRPDFPADLADSPKAESVCVDSPDRAFRDWVEDLVQTGGYRLWEPGSAEPPTLLLFDADPETEAVLTRLQTFKTQFPTALVVALCGLLSADQTARLTALGSTAVLAKNAPAVEWLEALRRLTGVPGRGPV